MAPADELDNRFDEPEDNGKDMFLDGGGGGGYDRPRDDVWGVLGRDPVVEFFHADDDADDDKDDEDDVGGGGGAGRAYLLWVEGVSLSKEIKGPETGVDFDCDDDDDDDDGIGADGCGDVDEAEVSSMFNNAFKDGDM
jgi:hypothetical protein